jgi:Carboxypeptidase regulatory-like domain
VTHVIVKSLRSLAIGCLMVAPLCLSSVLWGADGYGKLAGVILDPGGIPQMGATVWLSAEAPDGHPAARFLSNQNGAFTAQRLLPGMYSVRVTLSGFLPALEEHIHVSADATTLLRIEMDSVFASFDQLRRQPAQPSGADDWKWVLRSSAGARPVLQWRNGAVTVASTGSSSSDASVERAPRGRVEMTNGMREPGSSSALPGSPTTAASYDQPLGAAGRLLVSGGMVYDGRAFGAGMAFASIWLPSGVFGQGPETTAVVRDTSLGQQGQRLRNMRIEHSEHVALNDHAALEYGAEYLMAGSDKMTAAFRPRARVGMQLAPNWTAALGLETEPDSYRLRSRDAALASAMDALDTLPVLIWKNGQPAIEGSWHAEASARRTLGARGSVEAAAFHDDTAHQAVFAYGSPSGADLPLPVARLYAHDAGAESAWGARVVYRQSICNSLEVAAIYAWAGALAPNGVSSAPDLHEMLGMQYRHSVAGRVSGKVPHVNTQFAASYKWLDGVVVSRQDVFGEALLGIDPNLSVTIRQPLPSMHTGGHWEAIADFRNLMAQGYVRVDGQEGQMLLVPVLRSFRGGLSFQF